jgi:hypothetical protein
VFLKDLKLAVMLASRLEMMKDVKMDGMLVERMDEMLAALMVY